MNERCSAVGDAGRCTLYLGHGSYHARIVNGRWVEWFAAPPAEAYRPRHSAELAAAS